MGQSFAISATQTDVKVTGKTEKVRTGSCTFIVTNTSAVSITGRVRAVPLGETNAEWFKIDSKSIERDYEPNESYNVNVNIEVPPQIPKGTYRFRLDAFSEEHPHEDYTEGQTVSIEVEEAPEPKTKPPWWIYIAIGGAVLLLLIIILLITCPSPEVRVPDLEGMSYEQAADLLSDRQLRDSLIQTNLPNDQSLWIVIDQRPEEGASVERNTAVIVTIGVRVPSVVGATEESGRNLLTEAGFEPVFGGHRDTGQIPGRIVETRPEADEVVVAGDQVRYFVRRGPTVDQDCLGFDRERLEIRDDNSRFLLTHGGRRMKLFDERSDAERALEIINHYEMNSRCFVGRPGPSIEYWLTNDVSPTGSISGENCISFDPQNLTILPGFQGFILLEENRVIRSFPNREEAELTRDIIRMHSFTNLCFVVQRSNPAMTYFRR
ncbi:PASTA domain-containing protein [Chitinispirillales bacterium ANBcel5]|uniref:PASTA domain-containing protein n=1 Tax=Cellulosispirillum alkaliphilum TaxID=3039283 RepID=UPI002A54EDB4|nr:PASTA domain-containing protein [Chitinispirillales bacterium ANBcel5]